MAVEQKLTEQEIASLMEIQHPSKAIGDSIYGQTKVVEDLTDARLAAGGQIFFASEDVSVHGLDSAAPSIQFRAGGESIEQWTAPLRPSAKLSSAVMDRSTPGERSRAVARTTVGSAPAKVRTR